MSALWIAAAVVTVAVLVLLVVPLLRRSPPPPDRAAFERAVWRDQLAEIDRDVVRGVLAAEQADAARAEIKRRILATAPAGDASAAAPPTPRASPLPAVLLALAVPALAFGIYTSLGSPGTGDLPLAARAPERTLPAATAGDGPSASLADAAGRLRARLAERPEQPDGWLLLGRTYMTLGRPADAAEAFARALELTGGRSDVAAAYGEALAAADGGRIGPEARAAFARALAGDAHSPRARYYLALARAQDGDIAGALQDWVDLDFLSPPDASWLPAVRTQIARAAAELGIDPADLAPSAAVTALPPPPAAEAGPTREQVEAAGEMTEADRAAMIRAMVEGLAARLEAEPDDIEGWRRLAQAWTVLGEPERAAAARARVEELEDR